VKGSGPLLLLDHLQPGVLPGRLVKMAVKADIAGSVGFGGHGNTDGSGKMEDGSKDENRGFTCSLDGVGGIWSIHKD
jgi:hypothetical protein